MELVGLPMGFVQIRSLDLDAVALKIDLGKLTLGKVLWELRIFLHAYLSMFIFYSGQLQSFQILQLKFVKQLKLEDLKLSYHM